MSSNSGVAHFEYLVPNDAEDVNSQSEPLGLSAKDTVAYELQRIATDKPQIEALADCYRKICKVVISIQ